MKRLLFLPLILTNFFCFGQTNFVSIDTSSVACKNDLSAEYTKKHEVANKNLSTSSSSKVQVLKEIYSETQASFIDLINNNNFVCDSKINSYLQSLLTDILIKNSLNPSEYKILLSKDSEANAYNVGDGTVVINYGLFLIVDNEDELVFVISHEIGHQHLNHVKTQIESFADISTSKEIIAKTKEIQKQKFGKASRANNLLRKIKYENYANRRKKEIEADSLGFHFYKNTKRSPNAPISLLEKLDKSDAENDTLSVEEYKFIFEKNGLKLKDKYFQAEESLFKVYDFKRNYNIDSLKTHPDCSTRIQLIKEFIDKKDNEKGSQTDTFSEIKKHSSYQNLINLFSEKEYGISLYETLKLYKKDKENPFYKELIYQNIRNLYKARMNYTINRYVPAYDVKNNSTSLNRFITFINNIKASDLELILTHFKA
jgi:Zn-dependent protease with chaperone function